MIWSIHKKIFLFATGLIVFPVVLLGSLSYQGTEDILVERIKQNTQLSMHNAADHFIKRYIAETETTLNILTAEPLLYSIDEQDNVEHLLAEWEQHHRYSETIWSIFYGTKNGSFYITPSRGYPSFGYDPRTLSWYQEALDWQGIAWSEPYEGIAAGNMVVTASKRVDHNGALQGVLAIDTSLYKLSDIIRSIQIAPGAYCLLLDQHGNIIAHNEVALLGQSVQDVGWFRELSRLREQALDLRIEGRRHFVSAVFIPRTGWTLVGFIPEETFINEVLPIKRTTLFIALFGIFFASYVSFTISQGFVFRIHELLANIRKIESGNFAVTTQDDSTDEIGHVSRKFITMADTIRHLICERDHTEDQLRKQKAYFAQLFENSPESIAILDRADCIVAVNKQFEAFFQYSQCDIQGLWIDELVVPDYLSAESARFSCTTLRREIVQEETVRRRKDGSVVDVQLIGYPIVLEGELVGTYAIYRDISERKAAWRQVAYMTYHDALTGVYNRTWFELQLDRISQETFSYGVIVCDLDGLKLVNDTYGHVKGDSLLKAAANLLKTIATEEDGIARIGGDEFCLLVAGATEETLANCTEQLKIQIEEYNSQGQAENFPVSLSVGYAVVADGSGILDAFHEADGRMYKEKLHRSQSTRSAIVKTMMHALKARDFITEGHADRLQQLIEKLGHQINFPKFKIPDLRLFAQFHDIGKVGIPDSILFKPGLLDEKEKEVMRRHSEIGYRIAIASPELNHIADWILKHHEWWNGRGYPIGVSGQEIPSECRILAICDAYDAMVSDRPYRQALTPQAAIEEISRYSGRMF